MALKKRRERTGSGLGRVQEAAAKKSGDKLWFKISDGDIAYVRILDHGDDWKDAYCHRVPVEGEKGNSFTIDVPCLDQNEKGKACPGCKDDLDRRYKFWTNVIVRDWEDPDNPKAKPVDTLMIWSQGITIAKRLDKLSQKGIIQNRDLEVERTGSKMQDTKYDIEAATDDDEPLSKADKALAAKKHDLTRYSKPPAFDDFYKSPKDRDGENDKDVGNDSLNRDAFSAARKKRRVKNDDDDEETTTTRRKAKSRRVSSRDDDDEDDDDAPVRRRRR